MRNQTRYIILLSLMLCFANFASAQENKIEELIQQSIEELSESSEAELDYEEIYDILYNLYENPFNVNSATREDLKQIPFLNDILVEQLILHREKNGQFLSIFELKDIPSFTPILIRNIQPFITVIAIKKQDFTLKKALTYGRHDIFLRYSRVLEEKEGYSAISDSALAESPNSRYLGSPDQYYFRYTYRYKDKLSWALVGDKDAGEEFFQGQNKNGFDFYTGHLYVGKIGPVQDFVVGDYHLSFGQGLGLWSGVAFGKSAEDISLRKYAKGIKANTSRNESNFLRGAATTIKLPLHFEISAFYSEKWLDASLTQTDTLDAEEAVFSSINETGYHRTPSEIDKKRAVKEQLIGSHLSYRNQGLILGATWYQSQYDKTLTKPLTGYQLYDFQGDRNQIFAVDGSYNYKRLSLYGEAAQSESGGKALLAGIMMQLHSRFHLNLLYRNYAVDFHNTYSTAIAEGSTAKNESGLFLGSQLFIGKKSSIVAYYDLFKFPWLRFRIDSPSEGNELSLQWKQELNRSAYFSFRYKDEQKMLNPSSESGTVTHQPQALKKQSYRLHLSYKVHPQIILKSRIQWMDYQHENVKRSQGYLMYQDLKYVFNKTPLTLNFRYAIFKTDDYDSRLYAYESDVLYAFSIPAYYDQGQRFYAMANYKLGKRVSLWFRYSRTLLPHTNSISSGLEEIKMNHKSDIKVQMRIKI